MPDLLDRLVAAFAKTAIVLVLTSSGLLGVLSWVGALAILAGTVGVVVRYGSVAPHSKRWITEG